MSKIAEEVAYDLLNILSLLRAPSILQSDNGREFVKNAVTILKEFWPALKVIHENPRHLQIQGPVKRDNEDIENIKRAVKMGPGKRSKHSAGFEIKVIQFAKENGNRAAARMFDIGESSIR
ncbi:KRAB-A domain-containing protein 2 [Trichonephila clavipes]|nr:KRAB-A domain-containing protein 2 [Trichonephila clavipes]